jgi:hypothetical protein
LIHFTLAVATGRTCAWAGAATAAVLAAMASGAAIATPMTRRGARLVTNADLTAATDVLTLLSFLMLGCPLPEADNDR